MKRFEQLLVHLELESSIDSAVFRHASAVARLARSRRVQFVHTGRGATLVPGFPEAPAEHTAAWVHQANKRMDALIQRHFARPKGCRVEAHVLGGAGFHELMEHLRKEDIDLIIAGKSGHNVAFVERLVRKAPCSVMIVPPGARASYRRIMATTDFSENSSRAIEIAVAFAKARKLSSINCFHSYQLPYGHHKTGIPRQVFQQEIESAIRRRFEESRADIAFDGVAGAFTCRESPVVALSILREAKAQKSDLLVIGARGMDALAAALLGSTSAQVVRETKIATLIVKPKGASRALLEFLLGNR